ncbi:MAG TPA: hypothetical protein VFM82_10045 [Flavobacteriaceae bacterium]|nr:hypothetical protein [Flavobacteriaceae bacterium]
MICSFNIGFCQEETIVKGRIIFSSLNMSEINIINLSTNLGTVNNPEGEFKIAVAVGDRLLFSSVQYEPKYISITQEIFDKRWFQVKLVPALNELEPVTISNIDLSGNLWSDTELVEVKPFFNNNSLGLTTPAPRLSVEDRRLYTATTGGPGIIPLNLILNAISGRLKKLKRLKDYAELDQLVDKGMNSMEIDFFVSECGVPEKYIASFIYFCAENPSFPSLLEKGHEFDLTEFFKEQAILFKEKRGWETEN